VSNTPTSAWAGRSRAQRFAYSELEVDRRRGELRCHYRLDRQVFVERVGFDGVDPKAWELPGVEAAARWVFLLLGLSYYKAGAPPLVDLGGIALAEPDVEVLRQCYIDGLGEFAYRNGIDLCGLEIRASSATMSPSPTAGSATMPPSATTGSAPTATAGPAPTARADRAPSSVGELRALVPFGGGIDSIVTTELLRERLGGGGGDVGEEIALFVVSKAGDRYAAIEAPAAVTGLPILRAERELDGRILQSRQLGYLNGHVPVTGMISAIAVLAALLHGRDAVVMSNEASASAGNDVFVGDRVVNHQWSKGVAFETAFRGALARSCVPVEYFSLLRSASELWVARHFASLTRYHAVFRSCNRAFYVNPALRLDHWCGECDKCCFVDLMLAPFMDRPRLGEIFDGREPLANDSLAERFRALLAISSAPKPFDCVGDPAECRAALRLTARRGDRRDNALMHRLLAELPDEPATLSRLLHLSGQHFIPDAYAPGDLLV